MEHLFFPDSDGNSRLPFFPEGSDAYSRRPFFPDIGTYFGHPIFPDTGAYPRRPFADDKHCPGAYPRRPFADDKHCPGAYPSRPFADDKHCPGAYPSRPFADDKHLSTKPSRTAAKHQSGFTDNDRSRSRDNTSVPVHYAGDKNRSSFADHNHRSADDNSVPIHYASNKHKHSHAKHRSSDFADHKHRSTKSDRSAAAIKIQKIVRGFLVRKNMRRVRKIEAEIAEIGHQISALKLCDNAKRRLCIGEMLMALLLRLDAVRGVREYRKKVIRRVIQFQEAVDSIAQGRSVEEAVEDGGEIACREINRESFGVGLSIEDSMEESLKMAKVTPSGRAEELMANKEAIERAAVENETLKRMVEELCKRTRQQCDLFSGLVRRVENLESRVQDMEQRGKEKEDH